MNNKTLLAVATAALMMSAAAPALADTMGGGYHQGDTYSHDSNHNNDYSDRDNGYSDRDYGRAFHDRDFDNGGRFYYGGDIRQRFERLEHFARYLAHSGALNRWEARRAFAMLNDIHDEMHASRYHGAMSAWRRGAINRDLNQVRYFLRAHSDIGRHSDWHHHDDHNSY
jgi:hypothetical protein